MRFERSYPSFPKSDRSLGCRIAAALRPSATKSFTRRLAITTFQWIRIRCKQRTYTYVPIYIHTCLPLEALPFIPAPSIIQGGLLLYPGLSGSGFILSHQLLGVCTLQPQTPKPNPLFYFIGMSTYFNAGDSPFALYPTRWHSTAHRICTENYGGAFRQGIKVRRRGGGGY